MKKYYFITALLSLLFINLQAQKGPLVGSGKVVTKEYAFVDFDKLAIKDFDGIIKVEVGKPYGITIEIDDNLEPHLAVTKDKEESKLHIFLQNNKYGRLYLENTNIKIYVSLPSLTQMEHRGNTTLHVKGIKGANFQIENNGNGDAILSGEVDVLEIKKIGNGEVKAKNLTCKTSSVKSYGNGNVIVNALVALSAYGSGNCSVIQFGNGKIDPLSGILGNGSVKKM
jgi:hypothetical protein